MNDPIEGAARSSREADDGSVRRAEPLMPSIVFLRGVNVGGNKTLRPSLIAAQLKSLDVVSLGAAGTFVVGSSATEAEIRSAFRRKLSVDVPMMVTSAKQMADLFKRDPFGTRSTAKGDGDYISIVEKAFAKPVKCPIVIPEGSSWQIQIVDVNGVFVASVRRACVGGQFYPNEVVEKRFGLSATTRGWPTFMKIRQVLERFAQ